MNPVETAFAAFEAAVEAAEEDGAWFACHEHYGRAWALSEAYAEAEARKDRTWAEYERVLAASREGHDPQSS